MEFRQLLEARHSVRRFTDQPIERCVIDEMVEEAGLAPSSKNSKSSGFMIIEDKSTLEAISEMREHGSGLIKGAAAAIVVLGNTEASLKANVETLKVARREKATGLTEVERLRLDDEIVRFEHSLLSFRFREAGMGRKVDQAALERAAKELYEFRVANKAALGHLFGGVYGLYGKRGGEHRIWARVGGVPR